MNLLQLYYTSSRKGRSSGAGFQVYSASEGLTEEEILELERICTYIPPNNLPSQPTAEEIEQDFPVKFSSFRLRSGRYGVCQAVYVGQDYSGRFGNYFSHALIVEEGSWPFPPIQLYGSPLFRTSLTEAELAIEEHPDPLQSIRLEQPNGVITKSFVQRFLEGHNRYDYLQQMLNGLMDKGGSPGTIILSDQKKDIPYWIAAIQLSLPLQLANEQTFSTYVYDPDREDYVVMATTEEGTRFSFHDVGRRNDLYGFNFISNLYSEVKETYCYPDVVVKQQLALDPFYEFCHNFTLQNISKEFDDLYDLYQLCIGEMDHFEPVTLQAAFQFAKSHTRTDQLSKLVHDLSIDSFMEKCLDIDTTKVIADFLIDVSNQTEDKHHEERAAYFLLEKVQDLVTDGMPLDALQLFAQEQVKRMNSTATIRSLFVHDDYMAQLQEQLTAMQDIEKDNFYLTFTTEMMTEASIKWSELTQGQKAFILYLFARKLEAGQLAIDEWKQFTKDPSFFTFVWMDLYNKSLTEVTRKQLMTLLIELLEDQGTDEQWVHTCLQTMNETERGQKLLRKQFSVRMQGSSSIEEMFQLWKEASQFPTLNVSSLVIEIADKLLQSEADTTSHIIKLIRDETLSTTLEKDGVLESIIQHNEQHIDFSDQYIETNLDHYREFMTFLKKHHKKPHLYELIITTFEAKQASKKQLEVLEGLLLTYVSGRGFNDNKHMFQKYMTWALPTIVGMVYGKRKKESPLVSKLFQKYPDLMLHALSSSRQAAKMRHIPELFVDVFVGYHKEDVQEQDRQGMVDYLVTHEDKAKKVNELMKKHPQVQKQWKVMYEDVQSKTGNSFVRSLKNLLGSKKS